MDQIKPQNPRNKYIEIKTLFLIRNYFTVNQIEVTLHVKF